MVFSLFASDRATRPVAPRLSGATRIPSNDGIEIPGDLLREIKAIQTGVLQRQLINDAAPWQAPRETAADAAVKD